MNLKLNLLTQVIGILTPKKDGCSLTQMYFRMCFVQKQISGSSFRKTKKTQDYFILTKMKNGSCGKNNA
jgi:hypothetical protein